MMMFTRVALAGLMLAGGSVAARAGCTEDFTAQINDNKNAGPYEYTANIAVLKPDGSTAATITNVTRVVLPDAVQIASTAGGSTRYIVAVKGKAWMKVTDKWAPMDDAAAKELVDSVSNSGYVASAVNSNVQCLGTQTFQGKSAIAYKFDAAQAKGPTIPMTIYFDPDTKKPIESEGDITANGQTAHLVMKYTFDPALKIEAPTP